MNKIQYVNIKMDDGDRLITINSPITMGICDMNVTPSLRIDKDCTWFDLKFNQRVDTAGTTTVTINCPTKKELKELARALSTLADQIPAEV